MLTKEQTQKALAYARTMQGELDGHLVEAQQRVELHLANLAGVALSEMKCLKRYNELADGNIDNAKEQLDVAVISFRNCQEALQFKAREIEDMVRDLADEELWK